MEDFLSFENFLNNNTRSLLRKEYVSFDERTNDFKIDIDDKYCIIVSNEKIEYFLDEMKNRDCNEAIFKDSYLSLKNKETGKIENQKEEQKIAIDKINKIRTILYYQMEYQLDNAKSIMNSSDFPRHPLNKEQTTALVEIAKNKYKNLVDDRSLTITPVQIFFKNVSKICSSNRLENIEKFKSAFENKIKPVIENNKDCLNFFMITECEDGGIDQKHTFMILNINNSNFIIDSAGHEKYSADNIKDKVPSIIMFNDYMDENKDSNLYYTNTRIQVDHVNCYTMSYMTMCDLIEKFSVNKNLGDIEKYLASFFTKNVEDRIYNEGSLSELENSGEKRLLLPPELLVNSQSNSKYNEIIKYAPENIAEEYKFADGTNMKFRRDNSMVKSFVRDARGNAIEKDQVKIVDNRRAEMINEIDNFASRNIKNHTFSNSYSISDAFNENTPIATRYSMQSFHGIN